MFEFDSSKYKAALIDFDGTIVDTEELHYDSYSKALKSIGIEYVSFEEHVRDNITSNSEELLRSVLRKNGHTEVGLDELVLMKKYIFTQSFMTDGVKAIVGVIEFLFNIKQKGLKLALVSGGKYEAIIRVMLKAGIPNNFDLIITKDMQLKPKPDPESYLKCLELLGLEPKSCLAFENDKIGLEAALKAGVDSVYIDKYHFDDLIASKYPEVKILPNFKEITII